MDQLAVLVVDDDPDIRETLREVIEAEGYPVVTAESGRAALDLLQDDPLPALMLLDLMMPTMSGWELLGILRTDGRLSRLPVAVISASGARVAPKGATHYLRKPIDLDRLLDIVRRNGAEQGGVKPQPHTPSIFTR